MASYRPSNSKSTFPPPPQQQQQQQRPIQYSQNYSQIPPPPAPSSSTFPRSYPQIPTQHTFSQLHPSPHAQHAVPPPPPPYQQYQYQPPPAPQSSYPPPPPPPPPPELIQQQPPPRIYYPSSQYSQYGHKPLQNPMQPPPPPLPPSSVPSSSSLRPPTPQPPPKDSTTKKENVVSEITREHGHSSHSGAAKKKPQKPPVGGKKPSGRETEEERNLRKKKEFEKLRLEGKNNRQRLKDFHKGHGSNVGSRMGDRRTTPLLGLEFINNRMKKPTTFACKLKFLNELPDASGQPKFMKLKSDPDRFTKYTITSLEKKYKPELYADPDLGIPLDLLDLSVYKPPSVRPPLAPEDEELLRDDDELVPPVKQDGIRRKERPTDEGVSWLVKTQYISSLSDESTKKSLSEKRAKELRVKKADRDLLENLNNRESQIKEIEASFEACKLPPVHATDKNLKPVEILPLLPDFDRFLDKFVAITFDSSPTADSEYYMKLDQCVRDAIGSMAIMKACVTSSSDPAKQEKFLAYMAPKPNELSKDVYKEDEDISYNWIREYKWDVQGDDANDPKTFLVSFDENASRYVPLPTKLKLKKKRAIGGRFADEIEHVLPPSRITVRNKSSAAGIEIRETGANSNSGANTLNSRMGMSDDDDNNDRVRRMQRIARGKAIDHSIEDEDDSSD